MQGKKTRIFDKTRLRSSQLLTVADRRFDDAQFLRKSGQNARANGAMYLAGFVIECMLKAKLLDQHSWLGSTGSPEGLSRERQRLWFLCYRSHDLDEILCALPSVQERLGAAEQRGKQRVSQSLKSICAAWTIFARYSPLSADITEASEFLNKVDEVRKWLK